MHQIAFNGHLRPEPLVELTALTRPHSWIKGSLLLKEGDGKEMEGEIREGEKGKGRSGGKKL